MCGTVIMSNKKNVVIVGFGGMGHWHAGELASSDVATLLGIYDIKQSVIDDAKKEGIYTYSSFVIRRTIFIVTGYTYIHNYVYHKKQYGR